MLKLSDLWLSDGTIDRGPYAAFGVLGFAIKYAFDRVVAYLFFHRPWGLWSYVAASDRAARITSLSRAEAAFLATMVGTALPFI